MDRENPSKIHCFCLQYCVHQPVMGNIQVLVGGESDSAVNLNLKVKYSKNAKQKAVIE